MSFDTIKTGVIGTGHLGSIHLKKYLNIGHAELAGFWDNDPAVREKTAAETGVQPASSPEALLDNVDAVSVVVPTTEHRDVCLAAAERGVHVFVEKPIASTIAESDDIINAAEKHGIKLQVGHIERFNPAFRSLRDEVVDPKFIEAHRLAQFNPRGLDVPAVLDLLIHDIDLILQLISSPIARIDASGVGVVSDTSDIVNARLTFENGAVANVTASRISNKKMRKMRLFQRDSYISMDFITGESEVFRIAPKGGSFDDPGVLPVMQLAHDDVEKTVGFKKVANDRQDSIELELRSFLDCIANDTAPPVTGEEARNALAVALDIFEKSMQN